MGLTRLAISADLLLSLMMVAAFLVLGLISYFKLPAELNPQVDFPARHRTDHLRRHEPARNGNAGHQAD